MTRLLLDFGGVVIRTPFEMLHVLGGEEPGWRGPFDPDADALWRAMQRGDITERAYWDQRAGELFDGVYADPVRELMRVLLDRPETEVVRPEMAIFLDEIERPAVLTNDLSRFHPPAWVARMTILRRFDPLIDLSEVGVLKPDRRAFDVALERVGDEPAHVLFVDDQPRNLAGAEAVGMRTEWFDVTDVSGSIARIQARLSEFP
ncbi:MAG: HAD-IA family hydrolase [Acidimicrobiales bacterium]